MSETCRVNQLESIFLLPCMPKEKKTKTIIYWTISCVIGYKKKCLQIVNPEKEIKRLS